MDAGLIKAAGGLVIAHDNLYLPALRIGLVDDLGSEIQVAFQNDGTERLPARFELLVIISPLRLGPFEVVLLLLRGLRRVAERAQPLALALHLGLLIGYALMTRKQCLEGQHLVTPDEPGVALDRIEVVQVRMSREVGLGGGCRKALVPDNETPCDIVLRDEGLVRGVVQYVAREALGAHGLHCVEVKRVHDGYIPTSTHGRLAGEVRQAVHLGLVGLQRPVNEKMMAHPYRGSPVPHEVNEAGAVLPQITVKCGHGILGQGHFWGQESEKLGYMSSFLWSHS